MKKQGFTLIELMVVIVIMGILAAVAVPKLFGMIAKSKASEVGPAAGTYVKLEQAYISEAVAFGSWKIIGYKGPGNNTTGTNGGNKSSTTNFSYEDATGFSNESLLLSAANSTVGWTAKNNAKLNDCAINSTWTVTLSNAAGDTDGTFTSATTCGELTPSFNTIGK